MGNKFMKKQTIFKNLDIPKVKSTKSPIISTEIKDKALIYLSKALPPQCEYPIYHFGTKKMLNPSQLQNQRYQLPQSLSLLTYNVWFQAHNQQTRYQCIMKMLQASNADFICLQEVTAAFVKMLHAQSTNGWIKDYYVGVLPLGWYDTLIMSKYRCKFFKKRFDNTTMERSMLFAEMPVKGGDNIIVGSMHYQSLAGMEKFREEQIRLVQDATKQCKRVIIAGDYNYSDYANQNMVIDKSFKDIWLQVHSKSDVSSQTMPQTKRFSAWRPDHILCKLPSFQHIKKSQIHKIGTFTIPPYEKQQYSKIYQDNIVRTPSDHFGLISWIPIQ